MEIRVTLSHEQSKAIAAKPEQARALTQEIERLKLAMARRD
jgi:hypothetical protein